MENHFHLLIRTPEPNLPRGMAQLKSRYAQAYNKRRERVGPLFAGRYGARLIQQDRHLLEVFRYIALNPVTAGLCPAPSAWPWSAHAALTGERPPSPWLAIDEARAWFKSSDSVDGVSAYRDFVAADKTEIPAERGGVVVGDEEFRRRLLPDARPGTEFPERDWGDGRPDLNQLLQDGGTGHSIAIAYRRHGYSMPTIAAAIGVHVCTISRRLRAYEEATARMQDLTPSKVGGGA
jgi:putative transposase